MVLPISPGGRGYTTVIDEDEGQELEQIRCVVHTRELSRD